MEIGNLKDSFYNYSYGVPTQENRQTPGGYFQHGGSMHNSTENFGTMPQRYTECRPGQGDAGSNFGSNFQLTHPQQHLSKEYHFTVNGCVSINPGCNRTGFTHGPINVYPTDVSSIPHPEKADEIHQSTGSNNTLADFKHVIKREFNHQEEREGLSCTEDTDAKHAIERNVANIDGEGYEDASKLTTTPDPNTNADTKPPMSYIALIGKAILESSEKRLNLGSIYCWIESKFPYYVNRGQGWRNSVRHNLSLNDCFIKAGRCEDGKGNYWAIHPANLQDFMRGDFRQRRRSRKRGRKKEQELGMYNMHGGYLTQTPTYPSIGLNSSIMPASMSPMYSPYTEAERRAYKLDEALRNQGINGHFWNWVSQNNYPGICNSSVTSAMYGTTSTQWSNYS